MKSLTYKAFLAVVVGIFLILSAHSVFADSVSWQSYSDDAFASARARQKLVLVYVNSESCHWCQRMNSESFESPTIINLISKKFIPVSVNIVRDRSIADSFGAYGTPTFIVLNGNQQEVSRLVGYQSPDQLIAFLNSL
jgi:thiol:disulfide interchange protein DsbD